MVIWVKRVSTSLSERYKAQRGELRLLLPIDQGYDPLGRVCLDPDQQVQNTLRLIFQTFRRIGSAWK